MRRFNLRFAAGACILPLLLTAQDKQSAANKLPVKRVVLFKNGVGYFEHLGGVRGNDSVTISFTSGQLNDVLKSLTVLDLNGGRIAGVAYGTSAPINRQLGDLCAPLGQKATLADMLGTLRGTRIEFRNGAASVSGRLLSVERKSRTVGTISQDVDFLSLISEAGDVRTVELGASASVRLLEPGLAGKLDHCLNVVSAERDADVRNMVISTEGSGDRSLSVSYISEVPVWKSTYRLVLDSKAEKSLLQGWAIVDNIVGEDWNSVELSLVAGAPQSFIQNLSQPYFVQRPTIALPDTVSTTPQTYQGTLIPGSAQLRGMVSDRSGAGVAGASVKVLNANGETIGTATSGNDGTYAFPSLPEGPMQLSVEAPGFMPSRIDNLVAVAGRPMQQDAQLDVGNSVQTMEASAGALAKPSSPNLGNGRSLGLSKNGRGEGFGSGVVGAVSGGVFRAAQYQRGFDAAALSQTLGDLFEYKLKEPITILKNRSALVPIVQASVTAEKVSIWNERSGLPRPQRAMWITNSSGLTLDGGSVSVLEDQTFTGEGIFDPIRPGEKRLLSYATDLAVNASSKIGSQSQGVTRVIIAKGVMTQESEVQERKTYTFRNEDTTPRTIVVEHPVRAGYQLRSEIHPAETTADWMRFKLNVEAKQTASLVVDEASPRRTTFALTNITPDQVTLFLSQRSIDASIQRALQEILSQKDVIAALEAKSSGIDSETQSIFDDQQRLRENIKAMKGTAEEKSLLQRYTQQLNEQETRLETIHQQRAEIAAELAAANASLNGMIQKLAFDIKL